MNEKILELMSRLTQCLMDSLDRSDSDSRAHGELVQLHCELIDMQRCLDYTLHPEKYWPPEPR